jgi:hypothetical protein
MQRLKREERSLDLGQFVKVKKSIIGSGGTQSMWGVASVVCYAVAGIVVIALLAGLTLQYGEQMMGFRDASYKFKPKV